MQSAKRKIIFRNCVATTRLPAQTALIQHPPDARDLLEGGKSFLPILNSRQLGSLGEGAGTRSVTEGV